MDFHKEYTEELHGYNLEVEESDSTDESGNYIGDPAIFLRQDSDVIVVKIDMLMAIINDYHTYLANKEARAA